MPCRKAERTSISGAALSASDKPSVIAATISIGAVVVAVVGGANSGDGDGDGTIGSSGADGLAVAACVAAAAACESRPAVGAAVSIGIGTTVVAAVVAEAIAPAVAAAVVTAAAVVAAAISDGAEVGLVERGLGEGSRVGAADFGAAVAGVRVLVLGAGELDGFVVGLCVTLAVTRAVGPFDGEAAAAGRDVGAAVRNPDGAAVTLTGVGAVEVLAVGVGAVGVGFGLAPKMPQGSSGYTEASNRLATSAG